MWRSSNNDAKMDGRQMFMQLAPATDKEIICQKVKKGENIVPKQKHTAHQLNVSNVQGSGGLKRFRAYTSHRFHGKTKKQRRHLRKSIYGAFRRFQTYQSNAYSLEIIAYSSSKILGNIGGNINGTC